MRRLLVFAVAALLVGLSTPAPAPIEVNDSGTWRTLTSVEVNDSGTWRTIQEIYVNDSGTWRSVFVFETITAISNTVFGNCLAPCEATAIYELQSDGDIFHGTPAGPSDEGDWLTPTTGVANYEVRCTLDSGTLTSGDTCNGSTFLALTSHRSWSRTNSGIGSVQTVITLLIRRVSTGTPSKTIQITLDASIEP